MKNSANNLLAPFVLIIFMAVVSASAQAGKVLMIKDIEAQIIDGQSSFEQTDLNASVTNFTWSRVFAVCKFDCLFSGFDGTIENLTIDGIMIREGSIPVTNSTIDLDSLGAVQVYIASDFIILALTPKQLKILAKS